MKKIYETQSYIREYETEVTSSGKLEDGCFYVELEETIFFPEEGGQSADTGILTVIDTGDRVSLTGGMIKRGNAGEEDVIRYTVSAPLEAGTKVRCVLDWDNRYDRMQNHSGEHILTGVIHNRYGFDNVGFHLSDTGFVTLDLNGVISYEQVIEAEAEANRAVYSNLEIRDSYPSKEELGNIDYRSKIDIEGQVRLISIGGTGYDDSLDVCACCAPHVARTGEIGIIKVISVINWKGGIRISMLCGRRALEYINTEHALLTEASRMLSTEPANVPGIIEQHKKEITELKYRLGETMKQSAVDRIRNASGDELRCLFVEDDYPADVMKDIYNALTEKYDGYVGVFAGDDEQGYRYNAGSGELDSRELAAGLRERFGAKGGGSAQMIQGRVAASRDELTEYIRGL